jgi:acetyl-CoA carboxylase carboxyltransferase component
MTKSNERLEILLDSGSFSEMGRNAGFGTIDGRPVCVLSCEGVFSGCSDEVVELALKTGTPLIAIFDCSGIEIDHRALSDLARLFAKISIAGGVIPRISVLLGDCHGAFCYAQTDFVVMTKDCKMSMVPPDIIKVVTGKDAKIGGVEHAKTENCHLIAESDEDALMLVKRLLSYLPLNNMEDPPIAETSDDPARQTDQIANIIPEDPHKVYNVKDVITAVVDDGDFLEIQPDYAQNAVVGFGRMDGVTVGIVANNPMVFAGCLDMHSARKIARFVRFCDAFNIPIVTFVDTPGFLPDADQETSGLAYYATKLMQAYAEATVPLITIVLRKAYGSAYVAMGSKFLGADIVYAYPTAEFAVTDIDTDIKLLYGELSEEEKKKKLEEYRASSASAGSALERGDIDGIIDPKWTRSRIVNALRMLETKRKKLPPKKHSL